MKKIILFMLTSVILTSCNGFTKGAIGNPAGKVIVDGEHYTMIPGNFEWKEDNIQISRKSSPNIYELAELFETLEVDKGDTLKFEIEKNPSSITVVKLNEDGTSDNVEIKESKILMPTENGYYIYQIDTIWPEGKETFVFDVNVE